MNPQQTLNALFAQHHNAIRRTLTESAHFAPWVVDSALLLTFTQAGSKLSAGGALDRQTLLTAAVRQAVTLRRLAR